MESATWCRTPAAASAARRLRPEVSAGWQASALRTNIQTENPESPHYASEVLLGATREDSERGSRATNERGDYDDQTRGVGSASGTPDARSRPGRSRRREGTVRDRPRGLPGQGGSHG